MNSRKLLYYIVLSVVINVNFLLCQENKHIDVEKELNKGAIYLESIRRALSYLKTINYMK